MQLDVRAATADELSTCLAIREEVFIREQQVPRELEVDGRDDECWHWLAWVGEHPVGTARARLVRPPGTAKVERVAIRTPQRGLGYGHELMAAIEKDLRAEGLKRIVLAAQASAVPFYVRRGYVTEGEMFLEAGIEHRTMALDLTDKDA